MFNFITNNNIFHSSFNVYSYQQIDKTLLAKTLLIKACMFYMHNI